MKKYIIALPLLAALLLSSCKELSRVNPTDPEASNFIGIAYVGEAGEFTGLSAIAVYGGHVYCVDSSENNLSKYRLGGELVWKTSNPGTFNTPSGIAADAAQIYITDHSTAANYNVKTMDYAEPPGFTSASFLTPTVADKITTDGTYMYFATTDPPAIYKHSASDGSLNSAWAITQGSADGQMQRISDIDVLADGTIAATDPALNRITVFSNAGAFIKNIGVDSHITDIAVKGDRIIVPNANGVYELDYNGSKLKVWGEFGEGAGKITKPCPVAYGERYYIFGSGNSMKFFYEK